MRTWLSIPFFCLLLAGCGGTTDVSTASARGFNAVTGSSSLHIGAEGQEFGTPAFGVATSFQTINAVWSTFYVSQDGLTNLVTQDLTPAAGEEWTAVALGKQNSSTYPVTLALLQASAAPAAGSTKYRLLNASTNLSSGVDLYLTDVDADLTKWTPVIDGVAWDAWSDYVTTAVPSTVVEMRITRTGETKAIIDDKSFSMPTGKVRTLALVDSGTTAKLVSLDE